MARKELPTWATTVTPVSKTIALLMLIILPVLGFFYGRYYQQQIQVQQRQQSPIIYKIVAPPHAYTSPSSAPSTNGTSTCNTNADCPAGYFCTQAGPIVYSPNNQQHRTCWKKGSIMPL